jgi:hypothetical protein
VRLGLATVTDRVLRLTVDGWLLLDGLALELASAAAEAADVHPHQRP